MKRKYSDAAHAKKRLQDAYIDGLSEDEQADEARNWYEEYTPQYEATQPEQHQEMPF